MDELLAAIAKLVAHGNSDEVVTLLETKAPGIRQKIFQKGFDVAHGQESGKVTAAQAKVAELEGKVTAITAERDTARQANPDVARIHADYATKLAEKDALLLEEKGKAKAEKLAGAAKELESILAGPPFHVEPTMARVQARDHADRFQIGDDGALQVLQPGLTIPYAASGEKTGNMMLAEAIRAKVPAGFILAGGDGGSGDRPGPGGTVLTGQAKLVADINAKAEADRKAREGKPAGQDASAALSRMAVKST